MEGILVSTIETHLSTEKFKIAREKGLFTDIELLVGTGNSCQCFKVHSVFLACGSPVFEDILQKHLYAEMNFMPVQIPDVQPHIFKSLLDYLYGTKISFTSVQTALEIYKVAERYLVPYLKTESELYICNCINVENVLSSLQVADSNSMSILKLKCLEFIATFLEDVLKQKNFNKITEANFETLLQRDDLNASELQVLRTIARWETANKVNVEDRQGQASLVRYVRFTGFSVIDFCDFTTEYPSMIGSSDALQIVKHLRCPSKYDLPEWCSRSNSRMSNDNVITARKSL